MVDVYNARAGAAGFDAAARRAVVGDMIASDPPDAALSGAEFWNFDFIVTSAALHHMEKPALAIEMLVARLRKGGILLVLDWEGGFSKGGAHHSHDQGHHNHGHDHAHAQNAGGESELHGGGGEHGEHGSHAARVSSQDIAPHSTATSGEADNIRRLASEGTVIVDGFSEESMTRMLKDAGCDETGYVLTDEPFRFGDEGPMKGLVKTIFMARGRRAL